jgi:hypothetical protein
MIQDQENGAIISSLLSGSNSLPGPNGEYLEAYKNSRTRPHLALRYGPAPLARLVRCCPGSRSAPGSCRRGQPQPRVGRAPVVDVTLPAENFAPLHS